MTPGPSGPYAMFPAWRDPISQRSARGTDARPRNQGQRYAASTDRASHGGAGGCRRPRNPYPGALGDPLRNAFIFPIGYVPHSIWSLTQGVGAQEGPHVPQTRIA